MESEFVQLGGLSPEEYLGNGSESDVKGKKKSDFMEVGSRGLSWIYEKLKKLLVATKGVAAYPVVQFLKEQ